MTSFEAAIRWYGVVLAIALAVAPAVRWLARWLPDRGASITVPIAPLLVVWPVWFTSAAFAMPFTTAALVAVTGGVGIIGWSWAARTGQLDSTWLRGVVAVQLAFLLLFVLALWLRGFTPDLTGTEKPMEAAFLASSVRAETMPPPDPWYSGEPINYYYFGYVLLGSLARIAGIPATTGFNLAVPTLFAATVVSAGGFVWNAVRPAISGWPAAIGAVLGGILVAVAGNLYAPMRLLEGRWQTIEAPWWDTAVGIGWRSSRIVCDGPRQDGRCVFPAIETINEFPYFSFLLGDLHPHVMALPITIATLSLALGWLRAGPSPGHSSLVIAAASGWAAGSLYAVNSWDYPTYLLLLLAAMLVRFRSRIRFGLTLAGFALTASVLAWLPFWIEFVPPAAPAAGDLAWPGRMPILGRLAAVVGLHLGERTSIGEYLTIFGVPLALALLLVASTSGGRLAAGGASRGLVAGLAVFVVIAVAAGAPVLALSAIGVFAMARIAATSPAGSARFVSSVLFTAGLGLSGVVELVYLRDVFESRMNTLFKVYYQVWVVFGLAAALALVATWVAWQANPPRRALVTGAGLLAVALGAVYPALATPQWTDRFADWRGLDGIAYIEERQPDERAAIEWLMRHAAPGDVLVEAAGCSYQPNGDLPFNRASAYTGIPTIIGWGNNHQPQWRRGQPDLLEAIPGREEDVAAILGDPSGAIATRYGVDWLYVGTYERDDWQALCPTAGPYPGIDRLGMPESAWVEAFRSGEVVIYRRSIDPPAGGLSSPEPDSSLSSPIDAART